MKNLSLILNAVLIVAVGVLYYLHFSVKSDISNNRQSTVETSESDTLSVSEETTAVQDTVVLPEIKNATGKIAYINLEEFFQKYNYYQQGVKNIEKSIENKRNQLMEKQKLLEEDFQRYQQAAPTYSDAQRKSREQQLMEKEQELYKLRDQLEEQQANELTRFNETLLKKVDDYLKGLSKEQNYNYVFTYTKGGPASIVFAKDSLDITKQVVKALNNQKKK